MFPGLTFLLLRRYPLYGVEKGEWELYCLTSDPIERINLVDYRTGKVRDNAKVPGTSLKALKQKCNWLNKELTRQEYLASLNKTIPAAPAKIGIPVTTDT